MVRSIGYCSHLWHNLQAGELVIHFASCSLPRENKRTKYGSLSYCVREISHCPVGGVRKLMSYSIAGKFGGGFNLVASGNNVYEMPGKVLLN